MWLKETQVLWFFWNMGFILLKDFIILFVDLFLVYLLAFPTKARIQGKKDIVFRFILKYNILMDFSP
jgi:hypothetical protein